MNDECKRCRGAGVVVGILSASIIHCTIFEKENECPYVPDTQHNHQEPYRIPYMKSVNIDSTVASETQFPIDHENIIMTIKNPNGDTYLNFIDVSSRDTTKKSF